MVRIIFATIAALSAIGVSSSCQGLGTTSAALAGIVSVIAEDHWAVTNNPAGLAGLNRTSCSLFFSPGEYGLPELRTIAASAVLPTGPAVLGLAVKQFGFDLYRETSVHAGLGAGVASGFKCGVSIRYHRLDIKGYGDDRSIILQGGALIDLSSTISFGFAATNMTASTVGRRRERLPQTVAAGLRFESEEHFLASIEMEKDVRYPAIIKFGVRQRIVGFVDVSGGVSEHPQRVSAGVEVHYEWVEVGWAGSQQPDLGWTHQLSVAFELGK